MQPRIGVFGEFAVERLANAGPMGSDPIQARAVKAERDASLPALVVDLARHDQAARWLVLVTRLVASQALTSFRSYRTIRETL